MLAATIAVLSWAAVAQNPFYEPFPAHKVIGNVYYVGSKDLATYLITTPEGHILINSGFEETVPDQEIPVVGRGLVDRLLDG